MKKTILHLIFFCFLVSTAIAQTGTYPSNGLKSNSPKGSSEFSLGYKPAPFKINSVKRQDSDMRYKSSAAFPALFDLRTLNRVTSAKNQGGGTYGGNCTMFSSLGAVESRWLTMGLGEFDLSEQHMAACAGFEEEWGYGQGGNQFTCSSYLTRFKGPVLESQDQYNPEAPTCKSFLKPLAYVPESRWLPARDFELLKRTVYNYGAVYASIYWDASGASFNDTENTYHYSGSLSANHAVLVCGWDDSKITAGGTGAWIVKNSWGTEWADSGFFYISYQDTKFGADELAYYPTRWEKEEVDVSYVHDELGFTGQIFNNTNKVYELAKFISNESQLITHVGVVVPDPETVLDFHIYEDFNGEEPSNLIGSREDIYIEIPGVYTFELPAVVNGDFFIQVTREVGGDTVNHAVESFNEGFSNPVIEPDVNWVRREGADAWLNTNEADMALDFNLTIRAYARTSSAPVGLFQSDKKEACLNSEVTYTYLENNPADSWTWDFGSDASPSTANTKGPHKVTYSTEGTKTISLIVSGAGGKDTVIRHDYIDVVPAIRVNILQENLAFPQGQSREVAAYGADTYSWSPAAIVDNASSQTVMATPPAEGTHWLYVTGTQGSCSGTDSVVLSTTNKLPHDDMCNAMLIEPIGWIGSWTNEFATAEVDEPAPEDTDCYAALKWCTDTWGETVTNSLWYYFIGPENGFATIKTEGFDNQIAIYRADTCTDIKIENLVAANDDPDQTKPSILAARIDHLSVESGKRYYLQLDGSHGGDVGTFDLYFNSNPVGIDEQRIYQKSPALSIFPNPGMDIFNVRLNNTESSKIDIILYNLNGQILKQKHFEGISGSVFTRFDLSEHTGGVYHIRVLDGDRIINGKLVKR